MESNLVEHAKRELALLGEEPEVVDSYLKIVQVFADMGHSGYSAAHATQVVGALLQYHNLTPLTDDPDEWIHHGEDVWGDQGGIWQSNRNPGAFSSDGGKTYYFVDEVTSTSNPDPTYPTEHKEK